MHVHPGRGRAPGCRWLVQVSLSYPFAPEHEVQWGKCFVLLTKHLWENGLLGIILWLVPGGGVLAAWLSRAPPSVWDSPSAEFCSDKIVRPLPSGWRFSVASPLCPAMAFTMALLEGICQAHPLAACPKGILGIRAPPITSASWQRMMEKRTPRCQLEHLC